MPGGFGGQRAVKIADTRARIDLGIGIDQVNIKATTSEGLGFIGKREGLACHAIALIDRIAG